MFKETNEVESPATSPSAPQAPKTSPHTDRFLVDVQDSVPGRLIRRHLLAGDETNDIVIILDNWSENWTRMSEQPSRRTMAASLTTLGQC